SVRDSSGNRESHRCFGATRRAVGPGSFATVGPAGPFGGWTLGSTQSLGLNSKTRRLRRHRLLFGSTKRQSLTASAPAPGLGFKHAMAMRTTVAASPVCGQIPCRQVVPIATNQCCAAAITISSLTCGVVNISRIDVMNACSHGYLASPLQRCRWCRRNVPHFPVGMECREVQRHIGAEMIHQPGTLRLDFTG